MAIVSAEQFFGGKPPKSVSQPATNFNMGTQDTQQPNYFQRLTENVGTDISNRVETMNQINQSDAPFLEKNLQRFGQGAGMASNALEQTVAQIPGVGGALEGIGKGIDWLSKTPVISKIGELIGNTKTAQGLVQAYDTDANFKNTIDAIANTARLGADVTAARDIGVGTIKAGAATADTAANMVRPALRTSGKVMKSLGEGAYGVTVTPEEATSRAMMAYDAKQPNLSGRVKNFLTEGGGVGKPTTEANTAARLGLAGTEYRLGVQAKTISSKLWNDVIQPKLSEVKGAVNMKSFINEVEKEISKSGGDITRRRALQEALNSVKEDYKNVGKINLEKLQNYKEGWAEFLPDAFYKGKPIASALKEVRGIMADKARQVIYKYIGDEGKQAYIDYGNLQSIMKAGIKSTLGDPAAKSLTRDVWQFVMNKAITPVLTVGGKVLYKTGEGLEFMGNKGATTVRDIIHDVSVPKFKPSDNSKPSSPQSGMVNFGAKIGKDTSMADRVSYELSKFDTSPLTVNKKPLLSGSDTQFRLGQLKDILNKRALNASELKEADKLLKEVGGSNTNQSLLQEARKYKSAEEFVKAQANFAHGGGSEITKFDARKLTKGGELGKGVYFSGDVSKAKLYGGSITNIKADLKNPLEITSKELWDNGGLIEKFNTDPNYTKKLIERGYDGIIVRSGDKVDQGVVFDVKNTLTKSQLTDIWKKANSK